MKLVIDIDENLYTRLFDNGSIDAVDMLKAYVAIRKGIPLPKGHGDLIDRKLALNDNFRGLCEFQIYDDYVKMKNYLKSLPIIIKADKEEKEE